MKLRWMAALSLMMATSVAQAAQSNEVEVKGKDGESLAKAVVCSDCQSAASKDKCHSGRDSGWLNGKPCGKCLLEVNGPGILRYPYDLHFTGTLVDNAGEPVTNRFVKVFLPNGWGVRTKTSDKGTFRVMLGATADHKGTEPVITDLGKRVDVQKGDAAQYSIYLLPSAYKPCPADAAKPSEKKDGEHQKKPHAAPAEKL